MKNVLKRKSLLKNLVVLLTIAVSVVLFEQICKIVILTLCQETGSYYLLPGEFLKFVQEKNYGFLGLNAEPAVVTIIMVVAFLLFAVMGMFTDYKVAPLFSTGVGLIAGSVLTILVDRFATGYTLNYISITLKNELPAFAFSHIILLFGAILFVLDLLFAKKKEEK